MPREGNGNRHWPRDMPGQRRYVQRRDGGDGDIGETPPSIDAFGDSVVVATKVNEDSVATNLGKSAVGVDAARFKQFGTECIVCAHTRLKRRPSEENEGGNGHRHFSLSLERKM